VVEALVAVERHRLRLDLARDETAQRVAQERVLGRRREEIEGAVVVARLFQDTSPALGA